jgi:hypothetical protein
MKQGKKAFVQNFDNLKDIWVDDIANHNQNESN